MDNKGLSPGGKPGASHDRNAGGYMREYLFKMLSFVLSEARAALASEQICVAYGNMDRLLSADTEELEKIEGMSRSAAVLIKLLAYTASRRVAESFSFGKRHSDEEIFEFLKALYIGVPCETVYMMSFDAKHRAISCELMGEGTVNGSDIYPRKLLESAVKAGASSVIIAHNHPTSSSEPSRDDVISTERLAEIFCSSGIQLLYHVVVSGREYSVIAPSGAGANIEIE